MEDVLDETPNWLREHLSTRNPRVQQYQRRRNEGDWVNMIEVDNEADDEDDGVDFEEDWDIDVSEKEVVGIFQDRNYLKIDDYAIDMHCSAGRKLGKKKADFALEGCVVVGEDKEYYNRDWRDLYCDLKVNPAKYGIVDNNKRPKPK